MRKQIILPLLFAGLLACTTPAFADLEMEYRNNAASALNAKDYGTLQTIGENWLTSVEKGEVPKLGPTNAQIGFLVGYGLMQGVDSGTVNLSAEDYRRLVVENLQRHLEVNRKDFVRDVVFLADATRKLYEMGETKSQDDENLAVWSMWRAVVEAHKKSGFKRPVDDQTVSLIYKYIEFCKTMVETTEFPDLYRFRLRNACQLAFGANKEYDESYFWVWYDKTFFDDGNIRAGVLFQNALDASFAAEETDDAVKGVVQKFQKAIDLTKGNKYKAEIYLQLAEYLNFLSGDTWLDEAYRASQQAYRLNPYDRAIRDTYGSLLFRVGNAAIRDKNYGKALQIGIDGTSFVHEKDYELYLILAQAQQFHGMSIESIKNARTAYLKACTKVKVATDLDYFTQVYKGILENYGQGDKFKPCSGRPAGSSN